MQMKRSSSTQLSLRTLLASFAIGWGLLGSADAQLLPAANPISAIIPTTSFSLELEHVISLPDSSTGNNRFARIEQISPAIDGSGKLFASDQRGKLYSFNLGDAAPSLFFDFQNNISSFKNGNQQSGLRGFAFHPDAFTPGTPGFRKMYTAHELTTSTGGNSHQSRVSEWTLNSTLNGVDANSERPVLTEDQPRGDHNIGKLGFDPNMKPGDADYGNLYVSFGDGGNYRDASIGGSDATLNPNGQITTNRLGSIIRINPLESGNSPFSVPFDNPFFGVPGYLSEIWAHGLRNPHHFSWDTGGNGEMFIADIGQSNIEEVNIGRAGANYGWSQREGTFDVSNESPGNPTTSSILPANHVLDQFTYPVAQFDHDFDNSGQVNTAIAGGCVYRGTLVPELEGKYLFGSFGSDGEGPIYVVDADQLVERDDFSNVFTLNDGFLAPVEQLQLIDANGQPTTMLELIRDESDNEMQSRTDFRIGCDADGEVYISSKKDGTIRRFVETYVPLEGDYNQNDVVDAADFTIWRDTRGQTVDLRADGDQDGFISNLDYGIWFQNFGDVPAASALVPEPSGLTLLSFCLFSMLGLRRRRS